MLYPDELRAQIISIQTSKPGRGRGIRTPDILLPKQARYQTALYPVLGFYGRDCTRLSKNMQYPVLIAGYAIILQSSSLEPYNSPMPAHILSGQALASTTETALARQVATACAGGRRPPHLAVVLIGADAASQIYVQAKQRACRRVGIDTQLWHFDANITERECLEHLDRLNADAGVDGILVQLPLPAHINLNLVLESISPYKDVDGFHPLNLGRLAQKNPFLRPCTPYGIMQLLASTGVPLAGLEATIIGTSTIVGRPMALELLIAACTVTLCHSATKDLKSHVMRADLLVSAAGHPGLIPGKWIKPGAIVIDVGMNRRPHPSKPNTQQLIGDIEFEVARERAAWITPVPGGVGPMTIASLLKNTFFAYEFAQNQLK
jgi:methylenetetrahydrofolate dehydrogenase (NADP+) / methenyltetrahydrofolate cyclohydrolase